MTTARELSSLLLAGFLLANLLATPLAQGGAAPAAAPLPTQKSPPNETVIDALVREDSLPGAIKSYSVRYPYTAEARFTVDRVGRTRDIVILPVAAPTEIKQALSNAVARWRFWPAVGACRYVEQSAHATVVFEETRAALAAMVFEPVTALRAVPTMDFAWLDAADAGDRRVRPRLAPPKLVDPVALKQVMPRYPAAASRAAQPGWAFVLFEVGVDGKPGRIITNDGWAADSKLAPLFAKEGVNAIKQWRFLPATLAGQPQPRLACQRFMFNMRLGAQ